MAGTACCNRRRANGQLDFIYCRGPGDPSHGVSVSPLCVDSGTKRNNSSLTEQWVVFAGLCGPDRQGQLRARHPRAARGSGFPPICCCVHGHLRQVISLCLSFYKQA